LCAEEEKEYLAWFYSKYFYDDTTKSFYDRNTGELFDQRAFVDSVAPPKSPIGSPASPSSPGIQRKDTNSPTIDSTQVRNLAFPDFMLRLGLSRKKSIAGLFGRTNKSQWDIRFQRQKKCAWKKPFLKN
jgi:hypothetical protein